MNPTTTQADTRRPVGQGNSNWLGDIKSGNLAHTRQPAAKKDAPAATPVPAQPAPTPDKEGITAPVAASTTPVETVPIQSTPAAPASPEANAGTVPTGNQPVSALPPTQPEPPKTIVLDDPDAIIQIKNPDGTITEKSAKTLQWEEGMRSKLNRKDSELDLREKTFAAEVGLVKGDPFMNEYLKQRNLGRSETDARELAARNTGIQFSQPQQTVTPPSQDVRPVAPEGKIDGDPEYEAYKASLIAYEVRQGLKPITDALQQTQASQAETQRQRAQAEENYRHNTNLINAVLPGMLPFDLNALEVSDPVAYREALGRLRMAANAEGIDLSADGLRSLSGKLDHNTMRIIALTAVNDGWNPTVRKAAPAASSQSSIPIVDPVAQELSRKLAQGEPLVPAGEPTPPLIPVAPSGSPAGSSPNRMQQGTSSASVPNWRQRLGNPVK